MLSDYEAVRHRSHQIPPLAGLGVAAAILLSCVLVGGLSYLNGREAERRYQSPHHNAESAKTIAQRACAKDNTSDVVDCVYEHIEAGEEAAHSEQDLSAQQRAATSALVSTVIALVTLFISSVGLWALIKTLSQGQQTLERAREANELTKHQNRPFLILTDIVLEYDYDSAHLAVNYEVTNIGNSLAIMEHCVVQLELGSRANFGAGQFGRPAVIPIRPNEGYVPPHRISGGGDAEIMNPFFKNPSQGNAKLHGHIQYRDLLGVCRKNYFTYWVFTSADGPFVAPEKDASAWSEHIVTAADEI